MFQPPDVAWLARLRDQVSQGLVLTGEECTELARQGPGWDLVLDLTDYFMALLSPDQAAGCVSFARLRAWSLTGTTPPPWAEVELEVHLSVTDWMNPHGWRRIHRWLAAEAYLLALGAPNPHRPTQAARCEFDRIAAEAHLPLPCGQRAAAVVDAFAKWWDFTAQRVAHLFVTEIQPALQPEGLNQSQMIEQFQNWLVELFRLSLNCNDLLPALVIEKNDQLACCIDQLNAVSPPPPSPVWLAQWAACWTPTVTWQQADSEELARTLLGALVDNHDAHVPPDDLKNSPLWPLALRPTATVANVAGVQAAWTTLCAAVPVGPLPVGWGCCGPVEPGWIRGLVGRVRFADEEQQQVTLSVADGQRLGMLFLWLVGQGQGDRLTDAFIPLECTVIASVCLEPREVKVPVERLPHFLCELGALERAVRTRGLPVPWGQNLLVRDLFGGP